MRKTLSSKLGKFLVITAVILLLIFLNGRGVLKTPKSLAYNIFLPFQRISFALGRTAADFFSIFSRLKGMKDQNEKLIGENQSLLSEVVRLGELEKENEFLREELNLDKREDFSFALADVIGSDIQNSDQLLFINKGEADGIKTGDAVISVGRVLLGRVGEAAKNTSKIETLYNFAVKINAITEKSRVAGVLMNTDSGLLMDLIDIRKDMAEGERILTSGEPGAFPKGLYVGSISEIIKRDNQIYRQAKIAVPYNLKDIERVLIIKDASR